MAKVNLDELPLFCCIQLPVTIFGIFSSIHTYSTQSASSKTFYEQKRASLVKN